MGGGGEGGGGGCGVGGVNIMYKCLKWHFYFNGNYFRQTKGTAMGTKFAPVYATLVMGYLEETLYEKIKIRFGHEFGNEFIQNWKRFLDDCFIPWIKSSSELLELKDILNNLHADITFTMEYSNEQQPFLDVLVKQVGTKIETDIYYKSTNSKQYLLFNSCHPKHLRTSIPYSLARRIRTIVSNENTLHIRMNELKTTLTHQKYPRRIIENGIEKAMSINKSELRLVREKPNDSIITYVSTFNPTQPELFHAIQQNLPILYEDDLMKEIIQKYTIIKNKRQPNNLKGLLTKAKVGRKILRNRLN